jgi:hypothetical protein
VTRAVIAARSDLRALCGTVTEVPAPPAHIGVDSITAPSCLVLDTGRVSCWIDGWSGLVELRPSRSVSFSGRALAVLEERVQVARDRVRRRIRELHVACFEANAEMQQSLSTALRVEQGVSLDALALQTGLAAPLELRDIPKVGSLLSLREAGWSVSGRLRAELDRGDAAASSASSASFPHSLLALIPRFAAKPLAASSIAAPVTHHQNALLQTCAALSSQHEAEAFALLCAPGEAPLGSLLRAHLVPMLLDPAAPVSAPLKSLASPADLDLGALSNDPAVKGFLSNFPSPNALLLLARSSLNSSSTSSTPPAAPLRVSTQALVNLKAAAAVAVVVAEELARAHAFVGRALEVQAAWNSALASPGEGVLLEKRPRFLLVRPLGSQAPTPSAASTPASTSSLKRPREEDVPGAEPIAFPALSRDSLVLSLPAAPITVGPRVWRDSPFLRHRVVDVLADQVSQATSEGSAPPPRRRTRTGSAAGSFAGTVAGGPGPAIRQFELTSVALCRAAALALFADPTAPPAVVRGRDCIELGVASSAPPRAPIEPASSALLELVLRELAALDDPFADPSQASRNSDLPPVYVVLECPASFFAGASLQSLAECAEADPEGTAKVAKTRKLLLAITLAARKVADKRIVGVILVPLASDSAASARWSQADVQSTQANPSRNPSDSVFVPLLRSSIAFLGVLGTSSRTLMQSLSASLKQPQLAQLHLHDPSPESTPVLIPVSMKQISTN